MTQSRFESWVEAMVGTAIGFVIAFLAQCIVFPFYDLHPPVTAHLEITAIFTTISVARSYVVRRVFNGFKRV